jgi:hypothetical protein
MSKNKKNTAKKKTSTAKKKPAAKKKPLPKVDKIEIDVPTTDEVKDLVADTWKAIQADDFKLTEKTKKGFFARVKSWFKVS